MWLWGSASILSSQAQQTQLISAGQAVNITDLYIYLGDGDYSSQQTALRAFNARLNAAGIHPWGLDGSRSYFSDSDGPAPMYAAADALLAFNAKSAPNERFYGLQADMEPNDITGFLPTFHNNIPSSALSRTSGGVWYATQAQDREMLMENWLQIYATLKSKLQPAGVQLGAAMPSWTDNYFGEPVTCTYKGITQGITKHMMAILNDYVIMSYNTNTANAVNRIISQVTYADTLPSASRPRVFGGVETNIEVGSGISYGDTQGKNSRAYVLRDLQTIQSNLSAHPSFCGMSIHDWGGWQNLNP
jgi:hypothetical protein